MADEAVRGLAVLSAEVAFAIDDGRSGAEHDSSSENPEEATKLAVFPEAGQLPTSNVTKSSCVDGLKPLGSVSVRRMWT